MFPRLELLVATRRDFGTDLAGAARADERWQARRQGLRPPTSTWIGSRRRRPVPGARSASEMRDRRRAELGEIKEELRRHLHQPIPEQGGTGKLAEAGGQRLQRLSCGADQRPRSGRSANTSKPSGVAR